MSTKNELGDALKNLTQAELAKEALDIGNVKVHSAQTWAQAEQGQLCIGIKFLCDTTPMNYSGRTALASVSSGILESLAVPILAMVEQNVRDNLAKARAIATQIAAEFKVVQP